MAEDVHLSPPQITSRMRQLEQIGALRQYTALLDPAVIGLHVLAFTSISLEVQTTETSERFREAIASLDEVLECFATTGDADFLLKIATTDLAAFSALLMNQIMPIPQVRNVRSSIVMTELKNDTAFDLSHLT
ncbi:MAG: Lrp/AsnC family transcriptional regulator [Rhodospirillaceae bacterium]|nr:Lrp/AsnC family transcriptional regulator [Rhodospirillaceae bacterium]MBT6510637.1 Lrp/AsnC family transcriptional regulator [Rhodospirillaceae bacterium]MBT7613995.1 Lrp/AsnC family transcriptional regulator [Rhodospirillaceae bacterium]MBT7647426.1 Lrp/AsnC family transcriptional regulator [Rhodospirillaceae bacterium]